MDDVKGLSERLRALARAEHDDLSTAAEAADLIDRLTVNYPSEPPQPKPTPIAPPASPLVYRLIRDLYAGRGERGFLNTGISLCNMEAFTVSAGPDPGYDDLGFMLLFSECGPPSDGHVPHPIWFSFDDTLPARQIADALIAWADWAEKMREEAGDGWPEPAKEKER